tara:strand:+ start:602 stop:796 length:195 start_codon:yes stop_codon:yes gene_type:complete
MKLTESKLKRIILEEHARLTGEPLRITAEYLNRIIKEEYQNHLKNKRIQETARKVRRARRLRRR